MATKKILIAIFLASLLVSNLAHADGRYSIFGLGTKTCAFILEGAKAKKDRRLLKTYIGGHISGANEISSFRKAPVLNLQMDVLYHLVMQKCRDKPKGDLSTAIRDVFADEAK